MSESGQQLGESPLLSDRGATIISDRVVSSIAGMAAQEVDGVHMGGGASRTAGGVLGSLTGSESKTSGISVEVGRTETAIDLKMGIEYNKNILQTVEEVRRRITDRVQSMTGLRIKELNATITDITFPEKEERRRIGSRSAPRERDASADETASVPAPPATQDSEPEPGASRRDTTQGSTSRLLEQPVRDRSGREASEDMRFASAVAAFAMLLRDSEYRGAASYEQVLTLARGARGDDVQGYRGEFIGMVESARTLVAAAPIPERAAE